MSKIDERIWAILICVLLAAIGIMLGLIAFAAFFPEIARVWLG